MDNMENSVPYAGSIFFMLLVLLTGLVIPCGASQADFKNDFQKIPEALVFMPENTNAILVEKSTQRIFLYSSDKAAIHKVYGLSCSTGENDGIKSRAGDKKTPEGVYFFKNEYEDRYLAPVYGKKAFPTDYPNFLDRLAGRDGSAIWLHGTNKKLKPRDSNGCVAMNNSGILKFSKYISLNSTPMVVVDKIVYTDKKNLDAEKDEIYKMLKNWAISFENGDYHDFLQFYDSNYFPDMTWWQRWWKTREKIEKKGLSFKLLKSQAGIYRSGDVFVTLFDLGLGLSAKHVKLGKKELFIRKTPQGYKIIGDTFQTLSHKPVKAENPVCYAAEKLVFKAEHENFSFKKMVKEWLKAWSSKDMKKYADFYSKYFYSDKMNKSRWVARKKRLAHKYRQIHVTARNLKIHKGKNKTIISFFQVYRATGFSVKGIKRLVLVRKGNLWKIYRESWKRR